MPQQFLKPDTVAGASGKERRHFDYEFLYQGWVLFMCNSKPFMVGSNMILTEKKIGPWLTWEMEKEHAKLHLKEAYCSQPEITK